MTQLENTYKIQGSKDAFHQEIVFALGEASERVEA